MTTDTTYAYTGTFSLGSSTTGPSYNLFSCECVAIQVSFSAGIIGTMSVEISLDGTNYDTLNGSTVAIKNSDTTKVWVSGGLSAVANWRIRWARTSGSGTATVTVTGIHQE